MKQDPGFEMAERWMQPGEISRVGFLGSDQRKLIDILIDDGRIVHTIGLTHIKIARAMQRLADIAKSTFGSPVMVDGCLKVTMEESRGLLACPFKHQGMYPKENIRVANSETGESICFTALNIHMIREHGFYEGKGSPFRVEPQDVVRILKIRQD